MLTLREPRNGGASPAGTTFLLACRCVKGQHTITCRARCWSKCRHYYTAKRYGKRHLPRTCLGWYCFHIPACGLNIPTLSVFTGMATLH